MTNIVGLTGLKGSGKDTAAQLLKAAGYEDVKMSGGLKEMMRAFLYYCGVGSLTVERMIDGDLKEEPSNVLMGRTPRYFMQTLGTEFGRDLIHPDLWVNAFKFRAEELENVVCTDVRFPNEEAAINEIGGKIYRIERTTLLNESSLHVSEAYIPHIKVAGIIDNYGSVEELHREMQIRFVPHLDFDDLQEKIKNVTLRFQVTVDLKTENDWYQDTDEERPVPASERLEVELQSIRDSDGISVIFDPISVGDFTVNGRVV